MYEVLRDVSSQRQLLVELQTGQKVLLEAAGEWTVHKDGEDESYLHCPGLDAIYCCDLVHDIVYTHPSNQEE
eukprot:3260994-Amphidinium_carterae.1